MKRIPTPATHIFHSPNPCNLSSFISFVSVFRISWTSRGLFCQFTACAICRQTETIIMYIYIYIYTYKYNHCVVPTASRSFSLFHMSRIEKPTTSSLRRSRPPSRPPRRAPRRDDLLFTGRFILTIIVAIVIVLRNCRRSMHFSAESLWRGISPSW
jgi:hypothetical protein